MLEDIEAFGNMLRKFIFPTKKKYTNLIFFLMSLLLQLPVSFGDCNFNAGLVISVRSANICPLFKKKSYNFMASIQTGQM